MENPRPSRTAGKSKKKLPPPRKYLSRNEQFRLMFLVGTLMLVVILMNEARKPEYWTMFQGASAEADAAGDLGGDQTGGLEKPPRKADEGRLPGEITVEGFRWEAGALADDDARARHRAQKEFWRQQMELLPWEQRDDLPRVLKAVRDGQALSDEDTQQWQHTMATLDQRWKSYAQLAMDQVMDDPQLSDRDRAAWMSIIHQTHKHWNDELRQTLSVAADPRNLSQDQRAELARFEALFDEMSLDRVRDDTVVSRPAEVDAWFRLFEKLQAADGDVLAQAGARQIAVLQLSQQPDEHRGELVTIRGQAPYPYHVRAPKNLLGIEEYYIFTVFPRRGPSAPILVYCLELPDGFPAAEDGENANKERLTEQLQDVEFTGYSFKRCAYASKGGTEVAPLVLAKGPQWSPHPVEVAIEPPSWWAILAAIGGTALLGAMIAVWAYTRHSGQSAPAYGPASRATPAQLAGLRDAPLAPSPAETMAQLSGANQQETAEQDDG